MREHVKEFLDAADEGRPTTVTRDALLPWTPSSLVHFMTRVQPPARRSSPRTTDGQCSFPAFPWPPMAATLDEAVEEMMEALRDYAGAWVDHLRLAPNHADNWGLVQIVALASDEQLRDWLLP